MARPLRQGIDYFPLEVNFLKDLKTRKIIKACGATSPVILISLLSNIYRDNGYYVVWDKDMPFLISEETGVSEGAVREVVKKAMQVGFFCEQLFQQHNILTSRGIQARFVKAAERRKTIHLIADYNLLDATAEENPQISYVSENVSNNPVNAPENTQSKSKKRTVNQSKNTAALTGKEYDKNGIPYKCAKYLADKILSVNPTAKVPRDDTTMYLWCIHIDRLLRLDNKPPEELREVLTFAVKDPFWSANILSTKNFREKYDKLFAKMKQESMRQGNAKYAGNMKQGGQSGHSSSSSYNADPANDPYKNITSTDI